MRRNVENHFDGKKNIKKKGESQGIGIGGVNMVSLKVQKEVGWGGGG